MAIDFSSPSRPSLLRNTNLSMLYIFLLTLNGVPWFKATILCPTELAASHLWKCFNVVFTSTSQDNLKLCCVREQFGDSTDCASEGEVTKFMCTLVQFTQQNRITCIIRKVDFVAALACCLVHVFTTCTGIWWPHFSIFSTILSPCMLAYTNCLFFFFL